MMRPYPSMLLIVARVIFMTALGVSLFGGCDVEMATVPASTYRSAIESGKQVPIVQDFVRVFPSAHHGIAHYSGKKGKPVWNSEVGLYDRYVLSLRFEVTLDSARAQVVRSGDPQFLLTEIASLKPIDNGEWEVKYGGHKSFGLDEWKRLARADGDFNTFGLILKKDEPHQQFKRVLMW
jgi:hypothetical protein